MKKEGRLKDFKYDPSYPVVTGWDIGFDGTVIWYCQKIGEELKIIDCDMFENKDIPYVTNKVLNKPYTYQYQILPHDAVKRMITDKRKTAKGGNAVEIVGGIDPLTKKRHIKKDRVLYWISKGAKPSATVHNMLVAEKIIDAKKINVSKKSKKPVEAPSASSGQADATPATLETTTEVKPAEVVPAETPAEEPKPAIEEEKSEAVKEPEAKPEETKPVEPALVEAPKEEAKIVEEVKTIEEKIETPEENKEPVVAEELDQAK